MRRQLIISTIILVLGAGTLYAECSRDDVDYYLSKGFNPEQITRLCGKEASPPSTLSVADDPKLMLLAAIDAKQPELTDGRLVYTEKQCLEHGISGPFGRRDRICPEITFQIALANLQITDHSKRVGIFGKNRIEVKGNIQYKVINQSEFDEVEKRALARNILDKNTVFIPIQSNVKITDVMETLSGLISENTAPQ